MGFGQVRIEGDGFPISGDSLDGFPLRLKCDTKIGIGIGIIWIQCEGLTIGGNGILKMPLFSQSDSEITQCFGKIRFDGDSLADRPQRRVRFAGLISDDSQQMQNVGLPRLAGQDLPVEFLRCAQAPCPVVLVGQVEGLRKGQVRLSHRIEYRI